MFLTLTHYKLTHYKIVYPKSSVAIPDVLSMIEVSAAVLGVEWSPVLVVNTSSPAVPPLELWKTMFSCGHSCQLFVCIFECMCCFFSFAIFSLPGMIGGWGGGATGPTRPPPAPTKGGTTATGWITAAPKNFNTQFYFQGKYQFVF